MITYKHLRHEGKLYATRCQIQEGEFDPIGIGFAICSDKDNFCRKIGRELSFKRATIALISKRNSLPIKRLSSNNNKTVYYAGFNPKFKSIYWSMEAREKECTANMESEQNKVAYSRLSDFGFPVKKRYITPTIILEEAPKEKEGKLDWSCLPLTELQEVVRVFMFGKKKYGGAFTYRQSNGVPKEDLIAAMMRHLERIQAGEEVADDSQCLHIAHIAANCLMYIATLGKTK